MNAGISDCVVKLKLGWNGSGISTKFCQVTVGSLKLKVSGTIGSLVYNIIITAFKKLLKTQLEKYLTEMIQSTIEVRRQLPNALKLPTNTNLSSSPQLLGRCI